MKHSKIILKSSLIFIAVIVAIFIIEQLTGKVILPLPGSCYVSNNLGPQVTVKDMNMSRAECAELNHCEIVGLGVCPVRGRWSLI